MATPASADATDLNAVAALSQDEDDSRQSTVHKIALNIQTPHNGHLLQSDQVETPSPVGTVESSVNSIGSNELGAAKPRKDRPTSIVPPFWQHARQASRISVASSLGAGGIRLEDNTIVNDVGAQNSSNAPGNPLWARHVEIDEFVRIEGDIKGVGGYVVWLVRVQTLDGGSDIVLRKRYSEFEALHDNLRATFPNAGSSLPTLPPKSVFYKFKPSFLEKRRIGLKYFLNCVLLNPEFAGCPAVREFVFG